jgi:membrane protease YdiL (CAAX protease family)
MPRLWILALATTLIIAVVGFTTVQSGKLLRRWSPPFNLMLSLPENIVRLLLIGVLLGLGATLGPGYVALGWDLNRFAPDVLLGCLVALVLAPLLSFAWQVAVRRWGPETYNPVVLRAVLPTNRGEWAGIILALLPAAALEELLFRSLPLGGLAAVVDPWLLMWPLAVIFGLLHWPQGSWGVLGTTLISIVLSVLFLVTGGIWAPLIAHYVLNMLQITFAHQSGYRPLRS